MTIQKQGILVPATPYVYYTTPEACDTYTSL